eukprot:4302002-Prymnesium_polylepis.1
MGVSSVKTSNALRTHLKSVAGARLKMAASRNGREDFELNATQDEGRVLTPARLVTRRGRLNDSRCGVRLEMRTPKSA